MSYEIVFFGENLAWVGERIFNTDSNKKDRFIFFETVFFIFNRDISISLVIRFLTVWLYICILKLLA